MTSKLKFQTNSILFLSIMNISKLKCNSLILVDKFTYLGNSVLSTKNDINMLLANIWTATDRLSIIWRSDLSNIKKNAFFFDVSVVLILLFGCTTGTLSKRIEKKARQEVHKNTTSYIDQILEATSHERAAIQPLTCYF